MSGIQNKYVRKVLRTQSGIALIWLYSYPLSFLWPLEMSHKTRCWNLTQLHPFKKRLCHQSSATVYVSRCGFFFFFGWWFNLPSSSVATLLPLARGILSLVIKLGWARHWKNHKLNSELQKSLWYKCNINVSQCRGRFSVVLAHHHFEDFWSSFQLSFERTELKKSLLTSQKSIQPTVPI